MTRAVARLAIVVSLVAGFLAIAWLPTRSSTTAKGLTAITIVAELGDCRRFSSSRQAVRYAGLEHHRLPIRRSPRARASLPTRTIRAELGAV